MWTIPEILYSNREQNRPLREEEWQWFLATGSQATGSTILGYFRKLGLLKNGGKESVGQKNLQFNEKKMVSQEHESEGQLGQLGELGLIYARIPS